MENRIRSIKNKIKSCVSCNVDQCPAIRERLERHLLSYHTSSKEIVNNQQIKLERLSGPPTSKSAYKMTSSNKQTSTSDLITEERDKITNQTMFREGLGETVSEWAKLLPKYNASAENFKQNIVNELVERLNNISREENEEYYDLQLAIEIDKFIESLPSPPDTSETDLVNLKEILVEKICDLNQNFTNNINRTANEEGKKPLIKMKNYSTNTEQSFKNNLKYTDTQNYKNSAPYGSLGDNNESINDSNLEDVNHNKKKLVDGQVQPSFSSFEPSYGNMFQEPIYITDKQQNTEVLENVYKQIISNWLHNFNRNFDKNENNFMTDAILNRLKSLLNKKYTIYQIILLKTEILNCLQDYMTALTSPENYNQINRISDDLAVKLLGAKFNHKEVNFISIKSYFQNTKDKRLPTNFGTENHFDLIVQNIVSEKLKNLNLSNLIKRDIINIILQNMKLICIRQDHSIKALIFDILQHYTELTDCVISSIVKSILDQIRMLATNNYLQIYNSGSNFDSIKSCRPSLISVYKSEYDIRDPNNVLYSRKSSDSNYPQVKVDDRIYIENTSELIKAWMTILPTKGIKTMSKKNKEGIINNLAQDILDQVKLEKIVPETSVEKEKYLSFFIHRWLNRLNYFEDISDAQPYVEHLIEKLINIPAPPISKNYKSNNNQTLDNGKVIIAPENGNKEYYVNREPIKIYAQTNNMDLNIPNTLKPEVIMKEFIVKYIEHNYDEDNPITREVFGHILKTELKKLSTPTRKKVYDGFNKEINNILASEKIAKELQYINIISDWFKTLPIERFFNVPGNKQRAQYVNDLAKIISDLEENRSKLPPEVDCNRHLKSTLSHFINNLPITKQNSQDMSFLIDGFIARIVSLQSSSSCYAPCCTNVRGLSLNASGIPDQNLSDFIEAYIRENSDDIADDELKLDAWALRLLEEVDSMASENPSTLSTSEVYNRLADMSVQGSDIGKRFNLELGYAKEISNWLNNLPLLPIVDKSAEDLRIQMICSLAEKMSVRWHIRNINPNNIQVDVDLVAFIEKWIMDLPLDRNKEIILPLLIQQILNRMERVNEKEIPPLIQQQPQNNVSNICTPPYSHGNKDGAQELKRLDPGEAIVEAIGSWCENLPIQTESESGTKVLKEEFSTKLYKKVRELNKNPESLNNNFLYQHILGEEIDLEFDKLPQTPQLQNTRQKLKQQLLDIISENRNLMREKAAGVEYRQELAKTIEMSLPNPGPLQPKHSPGFNIYKNRLVDMFILENFDHSQDDVKLKYIKRLRRELDKYFPEAQNMNSIPITNEQMFNELYSSLFSVPPPNETSIVEEVEEVKTRCEIESWFESLPIRKATGLDELFEWDQIISMLAKRLHYMEKNETNYDDIIHKEITKWLLKLPMVSGQDENINYFANDLEERLKITLNNRKCRFRDPSMLQEESIKNKNKKKGILGTSQIAGPSSDGMPWLSPPLSPYPESIQKAPRRPSDLILDIVETWCQKLPLPENTEQEKDNAKLIRDNLVVKIILNISELNANLETFENDILYDVILDDELEVLISTLPSSKQLIQNKTVLKNQLKDAIKSIKPLIMEEKARYEYKQELKSTVDQVLEHSPNVPPEKVGLFISLRDEIVDNFLAYSFCKDDEEGQEVHKTIVHNAVEKYYVGIKNANSGEMPDPLLKSNQLLCELAKVPAPSAAVILEEIHEIRMKFHITDLFKELSFADDGSKLALKNQVKSTLARRLSDYNKTSFIQNRRKVKDDIMKCLQRIQNEFDSQKVEMFIKKLEDSENRRISQISADTRNNFPTFYRGGDKFTNNENVEDDQWMSLLPVTPRVHDPNYHDPIEFREFSKTSGEGGSPQVPGNAFDRSISKSGVNYDKFKGSEALFPSVQNQQSIQSLPNSRDNTRTVVRDQSQWTSVGPRNSVAPSQGYRYVDNDANRALESSQRSRGKSGQPENMINRRISQISADTRNNLPTSYKRGDKFTNNENVEDDQWMSLLPVTPRVHDPNYHDTIEIRKFSKTFGEGGSPHVPGHAFDRSISKSGVNYDKFKGSEPLSSSVQNHQSIQSLPNSSDNARTLVRDQSQWTSVDPRNRVVPSQGYRSVDNDANRSLESSQRSRGKSGQPQNMESHDIQPRFTQQIGVRPDLQKEFISPQYQNLNSYPQEHIPTQIRKRPQALIQNPPSQSQSAQQSGRMFNDNQNQVNTSAPKHQANSSSEITLQSQNVSPQQNQYRAHSPFRQTPTPQNRSPPCCSALPSNLTPPMPQCSSQTPYSNVRCNKSCRRPSITLIKLSEPQCNNNPSMRATIRSILNQDEENICSCNNKIKKHCRGSPVGPVYVRKPSRVCNGANPWYCSTEPYRRYYYC